MPSLTRNQMIFRDRLASQLGLHPNVVGAWIYHEQNGPAAQSYEKRKYYNWLNVGRTDSGDTGDAAAHIWSDPNRAADATVKWINTKSAPAIRNALRGARGKSPAQQATAIANSPWASSHYGGPQGLISLLGIGGKGSSGVSAAPAPGGGTTSSGGQTTTTTTGQPSLGAQQSQLPLIQALLDSQQQSGPPAASIQAPSFSAHAVMPEGFGTVSGGGGPAPKADIGALAAAVKTLGGDVPAAQSSSVVQNGRVLPTDSTLADAGAGQSHSGGASSALSWARSKVGAPGSQEVGGENHGKLADFLNTKFGMSGQPWCAMFTSAAVTKGGAPSTARTASVAQVRQKAQQGIGYERGFVHGSEAKPGDLILFGNDHIGMVESVGAGRINYVGGNQSDGVHEGVAQARGATIVRPKYGQRRR